MASKFHTCCRATLPVALFLLLASSLLAQQGPGIDPPAGPFPDAPSAVQEQQFSQTSYGRSQVPGPDPQLGDSSVPEQNSVSITVALTQPKRILYIIPNYRAVSVEANVPPRDAKGKFKLFAEDSFDYSSFLYVIFLSGIGMAQKNVPQFGEGADPFTRYYYFISLRVI